MMKVANKRSGRKQTIRAFNKAAAIMLMYKKNPQTINDQVGDKLGNSIYKATKS